ncbi:MAG: hypothetical protein V4635_08220 [Bacteroidota bacterium]
MIILSDKPGQLGNLLFLYAHFKAYCTENNVQLLNPAFHNYRPYFSGTSGFSLTGNKFVYKLSYFMARVLSRVGINNRLLGVVALGHDEKLDLAQAPQLKSALCFVQGWLFRSDVMLVRHKKEIKTFFGTSEFFSAGVRKFFADNFPDQHETVIGIHMRHGDYRTFENGKYYYDASRYVSLMKELSVLFSYKNPRFLICTNEKTAFDEKDTDGLKITYAPGHELLDLYCLAECGYIAGPPSTYNMWASFYGEVPLFTIQPANNPISEKDFKIYLG